MADAGVKAQGVGDRIVHLAGARTRDIVQVARRCYDLAAVRGRATVEDVEHSIEEIVAEEHDLLYECWLAAVLRATVRNSANFLIRSLTPQSTGGGRG